MEQTLDIAYFASTLATLTGVPVRLFEGDEKRLFSIIHLPIDPIALVMPEINLLTSNVAYYIASDFSYYGVLNHKETKLVIGPTRLLPFDSSSIKEMEFRLGISKQECQEFENAMKSIINMPLESLLLSLLSFNYVLNGEKKSLQDVLISSPTQEKLRKELVASSLDRSSLPKTDATVHNTYDVEKRVLNMVEKGDLVSLQELSKNAPAVRPGQLASESLRQDKNIFIVLTTLASRAAIKGGLSVNEALSLSDMYIQQNELLSFASSITNLEFRMISDFTERVSKIRGHEPLTSLGLQVSEYVYSHIHEPIRLNDLSKALCLSPTSLCRRYKKEMGVTIGDFIQARKTIEAKNLLANTSRSLSSIAFYLGYSSQSHFSKAFSSSTGLDPSLYRKQNKLS